jgi:recombination protein RecT
MSNDKLAIYRDALTKAQPSFAAAIPETVRKFLTPERVTKIALTAIGKTPKLMECTPHSILRAVMDATALGLDVSGGVMGQAYLVPYKDTCQLIVGYRGLIALARRSGNIESLAAHAVYEKDHFELEYGLAEKLVHRPSLDESRGKLIAVYCVSKFVGGGQHVETMLKSEVDAIRARSRAGQSGPWVTDYEQMALKTVIRRAAKYLPMSIDLADALERDEDTPDFTPEPINVTPVDAQPEVPQEGTFGFKKRGRTAKADLKPHEQAWFDKQKQAAPPQELPPPNEWDNVGPPPLDDEQGDHQ